MGDWGTVSEPGEMLRYVLCSYAGSTSTDHCRVDSTWSCRMEIYVFIVIGLLAVVVLQGQLKQLKGLVAAVEQRVAALEANGCGDAPD